MPLSQLNETILISFDLLILYKQFSLRTEYDFYEKLLTLVIFLGM